LENAYINADPKISDIFVYGDSLKSCLVALLMINEKDLKEIASELGVNDDPKENKFIK